MPPDRVRRAARRCQVVAPHRRVRVVSNYTPDLRPGLNYAAPTGLACARFDADYSHESRGSHASNIALQLRSGQAPHGATYSVSGREKHRARADRFA